MNDISTNEYKLSLPDNEIILYGLLFFNLLLTWIHFFRELKGRQWNYLGAIVGIEIPDKVGIGLFFVVPLLALWGLGAAGIAPLNLFDWVSPKVAIFSVAAIIGARISDSIFIHIRPNRQGYRPNPALGTIPYYLAEAAWLTVIFIPGLFHHYVSAFLGFATGGMFFYAVLPGLDFVRKLRRHEPWEPHSEIPAWTKQGQRENGYL